MLPKSTCQMQVLKSLSTCCVNDSLDAEKGSDDGISYCPDSPNQGQCRSLLFSHRAAMKQIGAIFHATGKIVSYNPIQIPRVDEMEHYDSIFTEMNMDDTGAVRLVGNVAAMSPLKPATMWTTSVPTTAQFEMLIMHGVYPMAPSPNGDHSLGLEGLQACLEYGPMLRALQGRVWRLEPHAIHAKSQVDVAANLFETPDGSLLAVLLLDSKATLTPNPSNPTNASVALAAVAAAPMKYEVLQVGRQSQWVTLQGRAMDGVVNVPMASNLAMLRATR